MDKRSAGVIGATSFVGTCLLARLLESDWQVTAFTRRSTEMFTQERRPAVSWRQINVRSSISDGEKIADWFFLAPVWTLPEHFDWLTAQGVRRIVVLSSTSALTKNHSADSSERTLAHQLAEGETQLITWATRQNVDWTILRPTLIYGLGHDRNIMEIVRFIHKFGFFPLAGKASGLRQPVYVADVASACQAVLFSGLAVNRIYNIAGGETLAYHDMVEKIFIAMGRTPRLLHLPEWLIRVGVKMVRILPRFQHITMGMINRMNQDLVFDYSAAIRDFGYAPGSFQLTEKDLY
ncbi:MAG: NAD-dependent epimerase/dehydratase family protein [Nitrosomonas sp.]|nr:NAD-dependent epimerase/dehydratase family protein [Nitrosomonas sp.]